MPGKKSAVNARSEIAFLTAVLSCSSASILIRFSDASPLIISFYRVFLAAVLLFSFNPARVIRQLRTLDRKKMGIATLGGVFLAVHFAAWITSLNYTTIANSVVLVDSAPLFALVVSHWLLKEGGTFVTYCAVFVTIAGAVLIGWGDFSANPDYFYGDLLAIIGAFAMSAYIVCGRYVRPHLSLVPFSVLVYTVSSLVLAVVCYESGINFSGYSSLNYVLFIGLAVIPTIGGHSLFQYCLRYMKAHVVNLGFLGEPVGATILAFLIFDEVPSWYFYAGGMLIIAGSMAAIMGERKSS